MLLPPSRHLVDLELEGKRKTFIKAGTIVNGKKKKQLTEDAFIFCEGFFLRKHCMIFAETCILKKGQIFQRGAWTPVIAAYS